jgi:hypothetical protein
LAKLTAPTASAGDPASRLAAELALLEVPPVPPELVDELEALFPPTGLPLEPAAWLEALAPPLPAAALELALWLEPPC